MPTRPIVLSVVKTNHWFYFSEIEVALEFYLELLIMGRSVPVPLHSRAFTSGHRCTFCVGVFSTKAERLVAMYSVIYSFSTIGQLGLRTD